MIIDATNEYAEENARDTLTRKLSQASGLVTLMQSACEEAVNLDFNALLTKAQEETVEKKATDLAVNRRIALAVLTRSRAQLIDGAGGSPESVGETLLDMVGAVEAFRDHAKDLQEIAEAAWARLMASLQTMVDEGMVE